MGALLLAAGRHVWPLTTEYRAKGELVLAREYRAKRTQGGLVLALSVGITRDRGGCFRCWVAPLFIITTCMGLHSLSAISSPNSKI